MNRSRYRWLIRLSILPVAGLLLLLWLSSRERARDLKIENRSQRTITLLQITVAGHTRTFRDMPDGGQVHVPLGASGGTFEIQGECADGTLLRGRFADTEGGPDVARLGLVVLPGGQITLGKSK